MPLPSVTVVLLNWNGRSWLEQFLPFLAASTYPAMRVLVVDNASSDDSVSWLKAHYPEVSCLVLDQNYGFAEGNNRAIPYVDTPYFVLLNSDVEVSPGWLEPLVAAAESHPDAASVQPKIRAWRQRDTFEYAGAAGGYLDSLGYPFCRGRIFDQLEKDEGQYETQTEIAWATGACCLIRTEVVKKIGLFDADFFAHMEEIDFCWRAQNQGYKILCEPQSVVWHVGGGTLPQGNPRKTFLNVRNSLVCLLKNLSLPRLLPVLIARLLLDGVWGLRSAAQRDWKSLGAILRAHGDFYRKLPLWIAKRKAARQGAEKGRGAGHYRGSIVWAHFVRGRKKWSELRTK
ncbi:MAG: glycosyltransferase family 2 protein [Bacteroidetes bacterium]|nr:MAG: glycosyltransferase family 2 protein [Bacteroidota bacterium]